MILKDDGVAVLGASGHAKVIIAALEAMGEHVVAVFDDDERLIGKELVGYPIVGQISQAPLYGCRRAIIAIGDNAARREVSKRIQMAWASIVHPWSWLHRSVRLGGGSASFAGVVIQPSTVIGEHVIVNTAATVDHDCTVEDYVHLAPGVHLAGNVHVGEGAFLGIGTSVVPGCRIGPWAIVGAGSVVLGDVPERAKVAGVPARAISSGRNR